MQILLTFIVVALLCVDWLQTLYIARHPWQYSEVNIILGKHPTVQRVDFYFSVWVIGTFLIGLFAGEILAYFYLIFIGVIELICVVNNYKIGIRI